MKLADRIAAWFGYVPAERLVAAALRPTGVVYDWGGGGEYVPLPHTVTTVKTPPSILVSADYKRGIPCS